nr:hypothetical protein [Bradyrhizobium sp. NAS96.2]
MKAFTRLAMKLRTYLAGLAERDGGATYNTAVLAGPEGLVGSYCKIHLSNADVGLGDGRRQVEGL